VVIVSGALKRSRVGGVIAPVVARLHRCGTNGLTLPWKS
jgi:hypothetical protein